MNKPLLLMLLFLGLYPRWCRSHIGSDLVTNGGFDSDTVWVKVDDVAIADGTANFTGGAQLYQAFPVVAGGVYRVTYTITEYTGGTLAGSIGGTALTNRESAATFTETVRAVSSASFVFNAVAELKIDNVSVRRIRPLWRKRGRL